MQVLWVVLQIVANVLALILFTIATYVSQFTPYEVLGVAHALFLVFKIADRPSSDLLPR